MDLVLEHLTTFLSHTLCVVGQTEVTTGTVILLVAGIFVLFIVTRVFDKWLSTKLAKVDAFSDLFKRRLMLLAKLSLWTIGLLCLLDSAHLNFSAAQVVTYFDGFFNVPFVHIGKTQITLWTIIYVVSLWLVLIVGTNKLQRWCADTLLTRTGIEYGAGHAISVIIKYVFVSIGFVVILQSAGVDLSALTVLAGALGLGLSFGLQNITSNLVSGLIVLIERPIKVGDRIEVAGITGDVKNIALRATTICTNDNIEIIVPNSQFISGNVINWSHSSRDVRISVPVGVAYNSDPEIVAKLLLEVASRHQGVVQNPPASVVFKGFGDSALDFLLRVHTQTYISQPALLTSELNFDIFKTFKSNNIEMPFPQRDLHIRSAVDFNAFLKSTTGKEFLVAPATPSEEVSPS